MEITETKNIAAEVLSKFDDVEKSTRKELSSFATIGPGTNNTFTNSAATEHANKLDSERKSALKQMFREPAIARLLVEYDDGKKDTIYITRTSTPSSLKTFASYRSQYGKLASAQLGEEFELPNGKYVSVISRVILNPQKPNDEWDSKNSEFESLQNSFFTINSLLRFLNEQDETTSNTDTEFDFDSFMSADSKKSSELILEGKRREIITSIGLRDQAILDPFQDEIFRLPLNEKIMILGPPGTGKTTTLIRRLGQKLDENHLTQEEAKIINSNNFENAETHASDWIMFTPTELLKHYLKEAFSREGIPAPDSNVRTWESFSRDLARTTFKILRSEDAKQGLILQDESEALGQIAYEKQSDFFEDFFARQFELFSKSSSALISTLENLQLPIPDRLLKALADLHSPENLIQFAELMIVHADEIEKLKLSVREDAETIIKSHINLIVNRDGNFISAFAEFLAQVNQSPESSSDINSEAEEYENEQPPVQGTNISSRDSLTSFKSYLSSQARSVASNRNINKSSKLYSVLEWLGNKALAEEQAFEAGQKLHQSLALSKLQTIVNDYFRKLPTRYNEFKKECQKQGEWFLSDSTRSLNITQHEMDCLLLAQLKVSNALLNRSSIRQNLNNKLFGGLREILQIHKTQVCVDEATDFSPVQLATMSELSALRGGSFFASGDFNQRLTSFGTKDKEEFVWAVNDIKFRSIEIPYRQSHRLKSFAEELIGNEVPQTKSVFANHSGYSPAALEDANSLENCLAWISQRIIEVEIIAGKLPSTAIFVNSEEQVEIVQVELQKMLSSKNLNVEACKDGRILGEGQNVRVFSIEHIKGLEFEAVFFVSIDQLVNKNPDLFLKYLYVGATRAATFLGVTSETSLPQSLNKIQSDFVENWQI